VAYGDDGLTYTFSGVTIPARPWTPLLREIKTRIESVTGKMFNFVLINRCVKISHITLIEYKENLSRK